MAIRSFTRTAVASTVRIGGASAIPQVLEALGADPAAVLAKAASTSGRSMTPGT